MATNTDADTDWYFDWPSGYVRYRNGKREVWQDSFSKPSQPALTDAEREAIEVAIRCVDSVRSWKAPQDALREKMIEHAATLRGLLERLG